MEIVSGLSQLHPGVHPHHIGNIQPDNKLDIGAAGVATQNEYGVAILDRFHALQSPRHVRSNPKKEKKYSTVLGIMQHVMHAQHTSTGCL